LKKKQAFLFFESNAALLSKQLRSLITNTLIYYTNYFNRFKKAKLMTAEEIIAAEKNPKFSIEDAFLTVKLRKEDSIIIFTDPLEYIKTSCLKIIEDVVETTNNFTRPELNFVKSDNKYLWAVQKDDPFVCKCKKEIEEIISSNEANIGNAINIYDKYKYLLVKF